MGIFDRIFGKSEAIEDNEPSYTTTLLESYDFTDALALTLEERFNSCIKRIENFHRQIGYPAPSARDAGCVLVEMDEAGSQISHLQLPEPPIPSTGTTQSEIEKFEGRLGITLPTEYSQFLRLWRYLDIYDGYRIWPPDSPNLKDLTPYISGDHRPPYKYLLFGDYWNFADGDGLMFDLNTPQSPVVLYLHDYGPLIEYFAPSFSLALWRIVSHISE